MRPPKCGVIKVTLSEKHKANLKKLADGLETFKPGPKRRFDMSTFCELGNDGTTDHKKTTCGTVGCACGYATEFVTRKRKDEDWWQYGVRVFGCDEDHSEWHWLFSPRWEAVDNKPQGAAARIRWLLKYGGVPTNYMAQIAGNAPLCYRVRKAAK